MLDFLSDVDTADTFTIIIVSDGRWDDDNFVAEQAEISAQQDRTDRGWVEG